MAAKRRVGLDPLMMNPAMKNSLSCTVTNLQLSVQNTTHRKDNEIFAGFKV